jgi:tripartite-type tricarboxylate transporter receptor subunit TctC
MTVWMGLVAPAGTPKPIVDRLHALVQAMLKEDPTLKRMAGAALDPMRMSQAEFAAFVKHEYGKWQAIVTNAGVAPQ